MIRFIPRWLNLRVARVLRWSHDSATFRLTRHLNYLRCPGNEQLLLCPPTDSYVGQSRLLSLKSRQQRTKGSPFYILHRSTTTPQRYYITMTNLVTWQLSATPRRHRWLRWEMVVPSYDLPSIAQPICVPWRHSGTQAERTAPSSDC